MSVLVLQHSRLGEPGLIGAALENRAIPADVRFPHEGDKIPDSPSDHDALIVLGGFMSANDDALYPHFPALLRLIRAYGEQDRPVLGVCLGAQLIARAWGGRVDRHTGFEFGFLEQRTTEAAAGDRIMRELPASFPIMQSHEDTFTLPPDAVLLADSPTCPNQVFRLGERTYAFQFHFEVTPEMVRAWSTSYAQATRQDEAALHRRMDEELATRGPAAAEIGRHIAAKWVELVPRA